MANNIPMCGMMKDMNKRGKILNAAFMVSGTFIIGDDLAFTASVNKEMILPVIVGKGVAGIAAVAVAWFCLPKNWKKRRILVTKIIKQKRTQHKRSKGCS